MQRKKHTTTHNSTNYEGFTNSQIQPDTMPSLGSDRLHCQMLLQDLQALHNSPSGRPRLRIRVPHILNNLQVGREGE